MGSAIDRLAAELMRLPASAWARVDALRADIPSGAVAEAAAALSAPRTDAAQMSAPRRGAGRSKTATGSKVSRKK